MNLERSAKKLKYAILERINKLPVDRYKLTKNKLPTALGVTKGTFNMWLYIGVDDHRQIPVNKLQAIAHFLNVKVDTLLNEPPQIITYEELETVKRENSARKMRIKKSNHLKIK